MIDINVTLGIWLLAATPIALLFILMLGFQWGAGEAAAISLLSSIIIAAAFFGADLQLIALESAMGIWSAMTILVIVWPAILIYEVTQEANAFDVIRSSIESFSPNKLLQILSIGWVFTSFLQGVTGFGVPVVVVAPLLLAMQIEPVWAVVVPLLGQAWGNTFGTLAAAWNSLVAQTGITGSNLLITALWSCVFLWILNFVAGLAICWFYGKTEGIRKGIPAVLIVSVIQGGGEVLMSQINQSLCAFLPAFLSLCAIFLLGRSKWYSDRWEVTNSQMVCKVKIEVGTKKSETTGLTFHQAFMPYYILTVIPLIVLLIRPIKDLFDGVSFGLPFPETSTSLGVVNSATSLYSPFTPFTNSGVFLLVSSIIGYFYFKIKRCYRENSGKIIACNLIEKTMPSTLTIVALVVISKIMSGSGQIIVLAKGTAAIAGGVYGFIAPLVGVLGTFVTGSNMSSNILFGQFQLGISNFLKASVPVILAAQTAGGSIGSIISPSKIILGTTTVGILGQEGVIMRKALPVVLVNSLLLGVLSLILA